jgi:hypothetical protein
VRLVAALAIPAALTCACGDVERPPAASPTKEAPVAKAAVGAKAPEFRVKDHTGRERTLAEFRGTRLVLWFFPKASTGG